MQKTLKKNKKTCVETLFYLILEKDQTANFQKAD